MSQPRGPEKAEVLRDLFDLQLRFAVVMAARKPMPFAEVLTWFTNFHRRLAYGNLSRMDPDPEWLALAARIAALGHAERLENLVSACAGRPEEGLPAHLFPFGCFRCEAPDERGQVRIHFGNRDSEDDIGPLDRSKIARRRGELRAMTAHIAQAWPQAQSIEGGSWLYNTEAYRRLFPPEFAASRRPYQGQRSIHGQSSWGQLVDFRGRVKPDMREAFLARLPHLDPDQPWLIFPLQVLSTTAPIAVFRREYGV